METRKIYKVEKFVPELCPKCKRPFRRPDEDYILYLGEIIEGRKVRFWRDHYDVIICHGCENLTARVMVEAVSVFDEVEARRLVEESGFTAISQGMAVGQVRETRTIYALGYGLTVVSYGGVIRDL